MKRGYELRGDPTELIMEILKQGSEVEVVAPGELRQAVMRQIQAALNRYHSLTM